MSYRRTTLAGLIHVASQRMVLNDSTAQSLNSTVRNAKPKLLDLSVETQDARYLVSAAPTLTTGVLLPDGYTYRLDGMSGTSALRFQRQTGTCVINIQAYKHVGDES